MTEERQTPEQALESLAAHLGIDTAEIESWETEWPTLMKDGVIVDLDIGRKRGWRKLTKDDLGLKDMSDEEYAKFESEFIDLGHKALLPKSVLVQADRLEHQARRNLEKYSSRTNWGRFVSAAVFAAWREKNEEYRRDYFALRDYIYASYDALVEQVRRGYAVAAAKAFSRLQLLAPQIAAQQPFEVFLSNFVRGVESQIPGREALSESFRFETRIYFIPLPSQMAEEQRRTASIEAETREEYRRLEARRRMEQEVLETYKQQKVQLIEGFLKDVSGQLYGLVYDAAVDVLTSIQKNGGLISRSAVQLRNLVERVQAMNVLGDKDLEAQIEKVRQLLDAEGLPAAKPGDLQDVLKDIGTASRYMLLGIGETPRSGRSVGIEDDVPDDLFQQVRRRARQEQSAEVQVDLSNFENAGRRSRREESSVA